MNKRELTLEIIRIEFAKNGVCTQRATRAYVEGRISYGSFKRVASIGLKQFRARQEAGSA